MLVIQGDWGDVDSPKILNRLRDKGYARRLVVGNDWSTVLDVVRECCLVMLDNVKLRNLDKLKLVKIKKWSELSS
jgi:hypothetical protein